MRVVLAPLMGLWVVVGFWCAAVRPVPATQAALISQGRWVEPEGAGAGGAGSGAGSACEAADQDRDPTQWSGAESEAGAEAVSVDLQVEAVEEVTPDVSWMAPADRWGSGDGGGAWGGVATAAVWTGD